MDKERFGVCNIANATVNRSANFWTTKVELN